MWDYKYWPVSTGPSQGLYWIILGARIRFKLVEFLNMLHSVSNIGGCSLSLVFAFCLSIILLFNSGHSEASIYHIKGKNCFCFPVLLWFKIVCVCVCACPRPILGLIPMEHKWTLSLWLMAIKPTPTDWLCPLHPDLAFSPAGLFTAYHCVPIDRFLKVTGTPLRTAPAACRNGH